MIHVWSLTNLGVLVQSNLMEDTRAQLSEREILSQIAWVMDGIANDMPVINCHILAPYWLRVMILPPHLSRGCYMNSQSTQRISSASVTILKQQERVRQPVAMMICCPVILIIWISLMQLLKFVHRLFPTYYSHLHLSPRRDSDCIL